MQIQIETIPHANQRYPTIGDWYEKDGVLHIKVSEELTADAAILVALHELVEVALCKKRGITEAQVDAFDMEYERNRKEGDESEAGDHPDAPYRKEHFFATNIERLMAGELGVDWEAYADQVETLP